MISTGFQRFSRTTSHTVNLLILWTHRVPLFVPKRKRISARKSPDPLLNRPMKICERRSFSGTFKLYMINNPKRLQNNGYRASNAKLKEQLKL